MQGGVDKVRSTEVDSPGMQRLNMHDRRVACRAPMHLEAGGRISLVRKEKLPDCRVRSLVTTHSSGRYAGRGRSDVPHSQSQQHDVPMNHEVRLGSKALHALLQVHTKNCSFAVSEEN